MRTILDTPFNTADLREAWDIDRRKATRVMRQFRRQYRQFLLLFACDGRVHNARKGFRAFRRRMNLLRRHDRERFDEWTAGLARGK